MQNRFCVFVCVCVCVAFSNASAFSIKTPTWPKKKNSQVRVLVKK